MDDDCPTVPLRRNRLPLPRPEHVPHPALVLVEDSPTQWPPRTSPPPPPRLPPPPPPPQTPTRRPPAYAIRAPRRPD